MTVLFNIVKLGLVYLLFFYVVISFPVNLRAQEGARQYFAPSTPAKEAPASFDMKASPSAPPAEVKVGEAPECRSFKDPEGKCMDAQIPGIAPSGKKFKQEKVNTLKFVKPVSVDSAEAGNTDKKAGVEKDLAKPEKVVDPVDFEEDWFKSIDTGMNVGGGEPVDEKNDEPLSRFGFDFFAPARKKILQMEKRIMNGDLRIPGLEQRDALSGFVGPLEMVTSSVYADIPDRYLLSPNDQITISYWGKMLDFTKLTLRVDRSGYIVIPKVGKMVARGMTLDQFQKSLQANMRRVTVKDLEIIVSLDKLRSLQVFITGHAFRPGSYAVSAMTTLFNGLYACGGPTDSGTLRDIKLIRGGETIRVDFYDYLFRGDSHNDIPLQPGDVIFISSAAKIISVRGEVRRPGIFELRSNENLKEALELADGIRATGIRRRVQVESVIPNKKRRLLDLDLGDNSKTGFHPLYDGDSITVYPLLPEIKNRVFLEGRVERPGEYQLKKSMRVSDLFSEINSPLGSAYLDRADIVRTNQDLLTTTLIPFNLKKALNNNPKHNIRLMSLDRIIVYSKWDVKYKPPAEAAVIGSVQRPGSYARSESMAVSDLLVMAGGVLPHTYLKRADLLRYDFKKEITTVIPVNLRSVLSGSKSADLLLKDRDMLRVYTRKESEFTPSHDIEIIGAVQRPRRYIRSENMTVGDLLVKAGGLLPNAYLDRADLLRYDFRNQNTVIIPVNIANILSGKSTADIALKDRDILRIFTLTEKRFTPPHKVNVFGAVQRPGEYERSAGMRLKDLLFATGDVMPGHKSEIEVARASREDEIEILKLDYGKVMSGDEKENIFLEDQDVVMVKKKTGFLDNPLFVTISGEVRYAGTYALKSRRERVSEVIKRAGGLTDLAYPKGAVFTRDREFMVTEEQKRDLYNSNEIFNTINNLEYERQLARNNFLWNKAREPDTQLPISAMGSAPVVSTGSDASKAAAISMAPATSAAVGKTVNGIFDAMGDLPSVVSRARKMGERELAASDRMIMDMEKALAKPGGEDDVILLPRDRIRIPGKPSTVGVVGAVMRPTSVTYKKDLDMNGYINLSGGFTDDANREKVLVVRVDGSIAPASKRKRIEYGDIIYVPPRVMTLDIVERVDKIIEVTKFALATTASVVVFVVLVGLF